MSVSSTHWTSGLITSRAVVAMDSSFGSVGFLAKAIDEEKVGELVEAISAAP